MLAAFTVVGQLPDEFPGEPGKCYAKCLIPDQYETITEQVLVKEASQRVEVVPAVYETVTEQVLSKEASSTTAKVVTLEPSSRLD